MVLPPLVVAFLAFLAGLLSALRFAPSPSLLFLVAAVSLGAAFHLLRDPAPGQARSCRGLLVIAFAASGAALGAARASAPDCRVDLPDRATVQVEGFLGAGIFPETISDGPPLLPLERATLEHRGSQCAAPVRAILPEDAPAALAGSRVSFRGTWHRSRVEHGDGGWPADGYRAGYLRTSGPIRIEEPSFVRNPLLTLRGLSENHLEGLFPRHFAMVEALLLGRRERVDPVVRDRFARSGLSHLLAISGGHVAVLAGVLVVLGGALRLPRRRITLATILLVAIYLALIGAPASALRAGVMVSLALLATLLQRPAAVLPLAASAAMALLAVQPLTVLDVGLQLSFAGVFGIIAAQRVFGQRLGRATRGSRWKWIVDTTVVSAAAFAATAPITAYHFGTVAPVSIVANLPAIPLTSLALIGVLASAAVAPIAPLANLFSAGTGLSLDLLDRVATLAADFPYGSAAIARGDLLAWSGAGMAAAGILVLVRRLRGVVRATLAAGTGFTALVLWPVVAAMPARGLEVHFIDVGQGDAVALRTPRGRWLLVDAGPRGSDYDAGERRVIPFFRARGVQRLEALILTHPDIDHIGGAPAVLRRMRVERIIEPGLAVGKDLYVELLEGARAEEALWMQARAGRVLALDGLEIAFLWPDSVTIAARVDANEASAIMILRFGEFSLLLPGDASSEVEDQLIRRHADALHADVLKAGHHGSATSTSAEFLRMVDPELVVISAGRRNRYGHPAPEVLSRLRTAGVEIARTDEEGTISLRVLNAETGHVLRIGE